MAYGTSRFSTMFAISPLILIEAYVQSESSITVKIHLDNILSACRMPQWLSSMSFPIKILKMFLIVKIHYYHSRILLGVKIRFIMFSKFFNILCSFLVVGHHISHFIQNKYIASGWYLNLEPPGIIGPRLSFTFFKGIGE